MNAILLRAQFLAFLVKGGWLDVLRNPVLTSCDLKILLIAEVFLLSNKDYE